MRQFFCDCWKKKQQGAVLEPLESQIASVIVEHPEYHAILENPDQAKAREYLPEMNETNPFLHMGMHLGIREQVATNRPDGVTELIQQLVLKLGDHEAEHQAMDCLAEALWQAQQSATSPDDLRYLECLKEKVRRLSR